MSAAANVVIVTDAVAQDALSRMRDRALDCESFHRQSDLLARRLAYRVFNGHHHQHQDRVVIAPVLRAGLALQGAFRETFSEAATHHIGIRRNERTLEPISYYPDQPRRIKPRTVAFLLDPMNATGGTAGYATQQLYNAGAAEVIIVNVIAADPGIVKIESQFPGITIYTVALDRELDAHGFIVPGLGDYGDRYFGTL